MHSIRFPFSDHRRSADWQKTTACPDRHGDGRKRRAGRVDLEDLIGQAKEVSSWSAWRDYIAGLG